MKIFFMMLSSMVVVPILTVCMGWCHGVEGEVEKIEAYCITAMYDDGEPMSYAAVEIKAPNTDIAFQSGRTDRNGCFMVKPDMPGAWQAVVSDGMGHRLALNIPVSADQEKTQPVEKTADAPATHRPMDRPIKIVAGLSIIFGLCGVSYGWKARHKHAV